MELQSGSLLDSSFKDLRLGSRNIRCKMHQASGLRQLVDELREPRLVLLLFRKVA